MTYTKLFRELGKDDAPIAGGKGASLGEMLQAEIPVPDGFVVLADTFDRFLEETDLTQEIDALLDQVNHEAIHTVETASEKIQALILSRPMPGAMEQEIKELFYNLGAEYVAVRSSATAEDGAEHAWAGQLDSFLNTTESDLIEKVRRCWASLFTPRAIFYRFEKGLHTTRISVAVVVQKMVNSEKSGIAFSVHPVTEDYNQLIIEAGFGLGEAIVSGSVTPDSYVVEKEPRNILDINVSHQTRALYRIEGGGSEWKNLAETLGNSQVLSQEEIYELSEAILRIEKHYGFPCDIEWAYEEGKFYIVQSRPITTLQLRENVEIKQTFVKAYTRNFSIIMQELWFAANKQGLVERLGLEEYPYDPPYVYFMKEGVEEVWENTEANAWLLARLKEKILNDEDFFLIVHQRYFENLSQVQEWWQKDIKTIQELKVFLNLVALGIADFVVLYGVLSDETIPQKYLSLAQEFREKDVFFSECNRVLDQALKNIYPDYGYLTCYITRDELDKNMTREELEKRDGGFGLIPGIFQGETDFSAFTKMFPQYVFEQDQVEEGAQVIAGQAAYKGKVSGKVRIVKRKDQVEAVQEGEIIVSPMTTPDFAPAMKKAAAFVTDEGGITCHAAIIARELKKPCIIGTKFATQVLEDGDLVEVDADNGVVRILEKRESKISLSKIFSREKTLFYFSMWNDSDRSGWLHFLNFEVSNNLFLIPGKGEKGSVWYSEKELLEFDELLLEKIKTDHHFIESVTSRLDAHWVEIYPYLVDEKKISNIDEFEAYYKHLVLWWSAMSTVFGIPDMEGVPTDIKEIILEYRATSEKFTEKMNKILVGFWNENFPDLTDLTFFVAPYEVRDLEGNPNKLIEIRSRLNGCFMLNSTIYPLEKLDTILEKEGIILNEVIVTNRDEIKGSIAFKGKVVGRVRKILSFDAMKEFQPGEVLITEMTNPDYLPIMRKAVAVVTDEGGSTCHAAIACRELKIPCIVGTKIATQVLYDRDLVEVDADSGVVRILERAESDDIEKNSDTIIPVTKENSIFTFESTGTSFIFEDIVSNHYMQWESLRVCKGDNMRVFIPKTETARMNKVGGMMEQSFLREKVENILEQSEIIKKRLEALRVKNQFSLEEFREFLGPLEIICDNYSFFDTHYSDGMVLGNGFSEAGEYVQSVKNVIRDALNLPFFDKNGWLKSGLNVLSRQFDISVESLEWYTETELLELFSDKQVSDKVLCDRKLSYTCYLDKDRKLVVFSGEESLKYFQTFQDDLTKIVNSISGVLAHKGNGSVRGEVKILKRVYSDPTVLQKGCEEMKDGQILVSDTTDPDFLPAMKKAGAIVTDIGGMLSHGSITSRELNKLCVIGTVNASKVLHDGDLVEVDADNGVVRILKHTDNLKIEEYQKLFQWPGDFSYFLSSYFMGVYNKYSAISLHDGNMWQSFIPLNEKEITLKQGLELYSSTEKYQQLKEGILDGYKELSKKFETLLTSESISQSEFKFFVKQALRHYEYYAQTEFFYTDLAYTKTEEFPQIIENFKTFEEIKLKGREFLNTIALAPGCYFDKLLEKIGMQFDLSLDELKKYSVEEIENLWENNRPHADELEARGTYFMHGQGDHFDVTVGESALQRIESFLETVETTNILKGSIASKGIFKGRARLFRFSTSEIDSVHTQVEEMVKGEVLVADTTAPEILLACKKAGAIVTNQGGMMSHAAIVSRELQIPCIVGTGYATEMIKTGDLVKVDADNGVVTILK